MISQIFINLPVRDLKKSIAFFTEIGFSFNPQFTDEKAACMILGEHKYAMLLVHPFFEDFTKLPVTDISKSREVIVAMSVTSKQRVDEINEKALLNGGRKANDAQDQGFMYVKSFLDLDGHMWEVFFINEMPATTKS